MMQNGLESMMRAKGEDHRAHFREWLLSAVKIPPKLVNSSLDTYVDYISGLIGQASVFEHQIQHYDPKHTMEIVDRLAELGKLPVRLIWGEDDAWQVIGWAHKLKQAIPGSELDILENCRHFAPEDQPEKLSELLVAFLQKQS